VRWPLALLLLVGLACGRKSDDPPPAPGSASGSGGSGSAVASVRLISLTPSATEVVAALGATSLLVGVDEYSEFPPEVKQLPDVGSFLTPNLEAIVRLRPTLVIVDDIHSGSARALGDAGIETVACAMHTLPDVTSALTTVGARLGRTAEATRIAADIQAAIDAAIARRPAKRPKVLAIIDREAGGLGNLVAAGSGSYVDELLALVGGANVLAGAGVRYPKLSMEEVLRAQPEVILDLSFAARGTKGMDPWRTVEVPAAKSGRLHALSEPYLIAPSPRVTLALDAMAKAIAEPGTR
jgi:iron complex transport system substrate-binding protein